MKAPTSLCKDPALFHKGKSGELRVWRVWTEGADIITEHGVHGGQLQTARKTATPKNVGRSNETTAEQQASIEAEAMHKFKLERKYSLTPEEAQMPLMLPMLAKKYEPKKHKSKVWYCQPKLDGMRCIARWENGKVVLISRAGKSFDLPHIQDALRSILPIEAVFDGELYIHGVQFQTLCSWIKKPQADSARIEYHVYDMPVLADGTEDAPFSIRVDALCDALPVAAITHTDSSAIKGVACFTIDGTGIHNLPDFEKRMLEQGYEGGIARHPEGKYLWGYRSDDLLKLKTFQDEEFEVIGFHGGVGKMVGHVIFECKNNTDQGGTFDVKPDGPMSALAEMYQNGDVYVHRKLTVKFFERTMDGLPRFPVGKGFRLVEDLPA